MPKIYNRKDEFKSGLEIEQEVHYFIDFNSLQRRLIESRAITKNYKVFRRISLLLYLLQSSRKDANRLAKK